jgi:hypothetical protein
MGRVIINRLVWNLPYHLPAGENGGVEPFSAIREALSETGRIALGRVFTQAAKHRAR